MHIYTPKNPNALEGFTEEKIYKTVPCFPPPERSEKGCRWFWVHDDQGNRRQENDLHFTCLSKTNVQVCKDILDDLALMLEAHGIPATTSEVTRESFAAEDDFRMLGPRCMGAVRTNRKTIYVKLPYDADGDFRRFMSISTI